MATAQENTGPAHLLDQVTGYPCPVLGARIGGNGATIVAFTGQKAASDGSYAYGVGLFVRECDYDPYVVWSVVLRSEGDWICESGSYCQTLGEAIEVYTSRGGRTTR